jgi:hypothetical protein
MKPLFLVVLLTAGCVTGCTALDAVSVGRTDRLGPPPFVLHYATALTPAEAVILSPVALEHVTMRDVRAVLHDLRRADLPDEPLNWEAALDTLVARLLRLP